MTPSITLTPLFSFTPSLTRTATATRTATWTGTVTFTPLPPTPTRTASFTRTPVFTGTVTRTRTITPTPSITRTPTPTSAEIGARVSYAGAIAQDGCPFCCEFLCQGSPTPTPFIDNQGREVFITTSRTFLLVIEGRRGTSNIDPGTNLFPTGGDRGDLQVLISRNIGNGSAAVCDAGPPPTPFGGVPGGPTDFGPGQSTTNAIVDMECRFTVQENSAVACTRDRQGDFAFLAGNVTRKQFCYQVPESAQFPLGDTAVGIQLRDLVGNIGPRKEIVVRVLP